MNPRQLDADAYVELDVLRLVSAVPLASQQYAEYIRQVARWLTDQNP